MAERREVAQRARRFDVYLTILDPVQGSEIAKTRPCVVVSPDELNEIVRTVIIVPMTTTRQRYHFRVASQFDGRAGDLAIDHIRAVDRSRLVRRLGALDRSTCRNLSAKLSEMFRY